MAEGPGCGAGLGVLAAALWLQQPKLKLCVWAPLVFLGELEKGCCQDPLDIRQDSAAQGLGCAFQGKAAPHVAVAHPKVASGGRAQAVSPFHSFLVSGVSLGTMSCCEEQMDASAAIPLAFPTAP